MYSGKIAVPPGGGGIVNKFIYCCLEILMCTSPKKFLLSLPVSSLGYASARNPNSDEKDALVVLIHK
jgi:hypothetical protein